MKRLLILMVLGTLLSSAVGCKFWDCLWKGPSYRQPCPPGAVSCPPACPPACNSCDTGPAITTPGPIGYQSQPTGQTP